MNEPASTKPYLVRAIYEWCTDNGYTPYVAVVVDEHTRVPMAHVRSGEIVLNISALATHRLQMTNSELTFTARFSGVAEDLWVPMTQIAAIYAKETGHGMAFEVPKPPAVQEVVDDPPEDSPPPSDPGPAPKGRPALRRVK
ncbi:SspB Stringent starvation protein B [Burkholderiales bacterium]